MLKEWDPDAPKIWNVFADIGSKMLKQNTKIKQILARKKSNKPGETQGHEHP